MNNINVLITISIVIIYSSLNAQWVQTNGPYGGNVNCLAVSGTNLFAGTQGGGVFLSTNDGISWQSVNIGRGDSIVYSLAVSGSYIFAGTYDISTNLYQVGGGLIFRSTNSGISWQVVDTSLPEEIVKCFAISDSNIFAGTIYLQGTGGIYHSTNNGKSWNQILGAGKYTYVSSLIISDSNVFAGTEGSSSCVFRSNNNGATWTVDDTTFKGGGGIRAFTVSGKNLIAGTNTGVYVSTNNGLSWSSVNNGLPDYVHKYGWVTTLEVCPNGAGGNNLFAGTDSAGIFLSTNNGISWTELGMTNIYINALATNGIYLFAGTNSGVWRRPLSEIVTSISEIKGNTLPLSFELMQNYPNPFNPSTTIKFRVPNSSFVNLKVYNVLGKEVTTLVNEEKPVGNYEISFNATGLPSGVYFYKLITGPFILIRKMILIK